MNDLNVLGCLSLTKLFFEFQQQNVYLPRQGIAGITSISSTAKSKKPLQVYDLQGFKDGAPGEIRTPDRSVRRRANEVINCYKSITCDLDHLYVAVKRRVKTG
ncbi:MAG: hypothetical protein GY781_21265 [Gammaproteobacteria bacterium]|nr:hypothetical protein [Gammaproteobacteria bacterium]